MIGGSFPLEWDVPPAGFRFGRGDEVKGEHDVLPSGPVLIRRRAAGAGTPRVYTPDLADPTLYLRVASLPPDDPDAILAFAGEYGFLGLDGTQGAGLRLASLTVCESLAGWAAAIVYL